MQTGKVFPRLQRKSRGSVKNKENNGQSQEAVVNEDDETSDYVFHIIATFEKPEICKIQL